MGAAATDMSRAELWRKLVVSDVARAYFNAPALTPAGDEYRCGELMVSTYGARPAAGNWQKCYSELLVKHGLERPMAKSCISRHDEKRRVPLGAR